jgi:hypothetical protein
MGLIDEKTESRKSRATFPLMRRVGLLVSNRDCWAPASTGSNLKLLSLFLFSLAGLEYFY